MVRARGRTADWILLKMASTQPPQTSPLFLDRHEPGWSLGGGGSQFGMLLRRTQRAPRVLVRAHGMRADTHNVANREAGAVDRRGGRGQSSGHSNGQQQERRHARHIG